MQLFYNTHVYWLLSPWSHVLTTHKQLGVTVNACTVVFFAKIAVPPKLSCSTDQPVRKWDSFVIAFCRDFFGLAYPVVKIEPSQIWAILSSEKSRSPATAIKVSESRHNSRTSISKLRMKLLHNYLKERNIKSHFTCVASFNAHYSVCTTKLMHM